MKKILINASYGCFRLSDEVYNQLGWREYSYKPNFDNTFNRDDKKLIEIVEKIGLDKASGIGAKLKIVEIPDDVDWEIKDYDGAEWVTEKCRVWR